MPRVVTAGVPMRRPEAMYGLRVSKGTVFLLTVMPARPSQRSAFLPEMKSAPRSIRKRWLSVPPETIRSVP